MGLTIERHEPEREIIRGIFEVALRAVDPEVAVRSALAGRSLEHATVIAIGKAAAAMARGAAGLAPAGGLVVSDHAEPIPARFEFQLGGHPVPDEGSVAGARKAMELLAAGSGPVLFLISGGASALCEQPVRGVAPDDVARLNEALLRSGAEIVELNTVRKHLSQVKGGRLAQLVADRTALSLILSDVVGSPLTAIGSGPTVPDPTTYGDALAILDRYEIDGPESVLAELRAGAAGQRSETLEEPIPGHEAVVVGDGRLAAESAAKAAAAVDIDARIETTELTGDAATTAQGAIDRAQLGMTLYAGETTVTVTGSGIGGRNQHAALAAALAVEHQSDIWFGALATDGVDGRSPAAGAVVDPTTVARGRTLGLDARDHLEAHDSHTYLAATGDLLGGGPTGTNVGDLWAVWRR